MGKLISFPKNIDIIKLFGCERSMMVINDITSILELNLDLTTYGYKILREENLDAINLTDLIRQQKIRELAKKRALFQLKRDIKDESILALSYTSEDGKTAYVTLGPEKRYIDLYIEDSSKSPIMGLRIYKDKEYEGLPHNMEIRYTEQLARDYSSSLYELSVDVNGAGKPVKIELSSYSLATLMEESNYEEVCDSLRDLDIKLPKMSKSDDITLVGPGLNLEMVFKPQYIRNRGEQSPINPTGVSR